MNIQIGDKKKKKISVGLNSRKRQAPKNVFRTESSSSDEDTPVTARQAVNREIVREQQAHAASSAKMEEYDFDGTYDVDSKQADKTKDDTADGTTERKSRYMEDLVLAAKKRKQERDVVFERKVAREQAAEEAANPEYLGKDRFVTAAYKRKLQERQVWQAEEDEKARIEAANDVTKKSDGLMSFYGNFNKNVSVGGKQESRVEDKSVHVAEGPNKAVPTSPSTTYKLKQGEAGADEHENHTDSRQSDDSTKEITKPSATKEKDGPEDVDTRRKRQRKEREKKVEQARIRYFQRHPALVDSTVGWLPKSTV